MKQHKRICKLCGKEFYVDKLSRSEYCSKECRAERNRIRSHTYYMNMKNGVVKKDDGSAQEKVFVKIRITEPLDLFDHMCPDVGSVHEAEKILVSKFAPTQIYIIRNIGKYGLVVRGNECEEIGGV